ncbi:hypothetical protein ACIBI4_06230 [Streptomyces sp. NPDC050418]|uniref:hypothetical protein n=1 Tax=Streptomyces sp. NPDC050418 TaxID=3365612 RepID=UPI0037BCFAD4
MPDYTHRVRLARGHLVHLARLARGPLGMTLIITACGHTYRLSGVADLAAEGNVCCGCMTAVAVPART